MNMRLNFPQLLKKRPFIRFIIVVLIVVALSRLFLLALWFFHSAANLPRVQITMQSNESPVRGLGLNLKKIPARNLIQNSSFEDRSIDQVFSVEGYEDGSIYVLPESEKVFYEEDDFFENGNLRVMSFDDEAFSQRLQSSVAEYKINQLGLWSRYELPRTKIQDFSISDISMMATTMIAVGNNGTIIADPLTSAAQIVELETRANFVSCISTAERFWVLAQNGDVYTSQDGRRWNAIPGVVDIAHDFYDIALVGSAGIAVGSSGAMIQYYDGKAEQLDSGTEESLYTISGDGSRLLAAGENNTLTTTSNGSVCRLLTENEKPDVPLDTIWLTSDYKNGMYLLGSENGFIAVGSFTDGLFSFTTERVLDENNKMVLIKTVRILENGNILVQAEDGALYCSENKGENWISLETNMSELKGNLGVLYVSSDDLLYFIKERMCYQTRLYTRISFEDEVEDHVEIMRGDMLFLNKIIHTEGEDDYSSGVWETIGESAQSRVFSDAPADGGHSSMLLKGSESEGEYHALSQKISSDGKDTLKAGEFYRADVWLKQKNIENDEVLLWFTGAFETIGKRFISVGESWRQYSFVFSIPRDAKINSELDQRLFIGFQGDGELYIDRVSLSLSSESGDLFDPQFLKEMKATSSQYVRLENLGLGVQNTLVDSWRMPVGNEGVSMVEDKIESTGITDLSSSLQLVSEMEASPWFVIDSNVTSAEIEAMIAYMCGPFSDQFGKMRVANGKAVTWDRDFEHIIFEITDTNHIFDTDIQKGAFVRYIQSVIENSMYFLDIKDRVFFLDGMIYESGKMNSFADSHTSSLQLEYFSNDENILSGDDVAELIDQSYFSYFDGIPRIVSTVASARNNTEFSSDEWIRSALILKMGENNEREKVHQRINAAEYVYFFLQNLGVNTSVVLADLYLSSEREETLDNIFFSDGDFSDSMSIQNGNTIVNVVGLLNNVVKGESLEVQFSDLKHSEPDTDEVESTLESGLQSLEGIRAFAFKDGNEVHIVLLNLSNQIKMFRLDSEMSIRGSRMKRYSEYGSFLEEARINDESYQISLTAGQVVVISSN